MKLVVVQSIQQLLGSGRSLSFLVPKPVVLLRGSFQNPDFQICAVFRGTGPKSGGPVPDLADRSHKNDFYGTGPIKITFMGPVPNYTLFLWTGPIKMVWTTQKQPHYQPPALFEASSLTHSHLALFVASSITCSIEPHQQPPALLAVSNLTSSTPVLLIAFSLNCTLQPHLHAASSLTCSDQLHQQPPASLLLSNLHISASRQCFWHHLLISQWTVGRMSSFLGSADASTDSNFWVGGCILRLQFLGRRMHPQDVGSPKVKVRQKMMLRVSTARGAIRWILSQIVTQFELDCYIAVLLR